MTSESIGSLDAVSMRWRCRGLPLGGDHEQRQAANWLSLAGSTMS
jgi:hypothetical protein